MFPMAARGIIDCVEDMPICTAPFKERIVAEIRLRVSGWSAVSQKKIGQTPGSLCRLLLSSLELKIVEVLVGHLDRLSFQHLPYTSICQWDD